MPTLYVENIPGDLYEALRGRARLHHRSVAAEILALLEENIPTGKELKARQAFLRMAQRMRSKNVKATSTVPATEDLQRQDRNR